MDCNCTIIKTCELKGSTFRSHVLDFGDFDISDYEFESNFTNSLGHKIATQPLEKFVNMVVFPLAILESKSGIIIGDVWMIKDGVRDLAVRFEITISSSCTGCSDSTDHEITVTFEELVIPVTVTQSIVNINLSWEDLTPEQILELQQPAIDAGNEVRQQVDEYLEVAQLAEDARVSAEDYRVIMENSRRSAETGRRHAENDRVDAENTRVNQEETRRTFEDQRIDAESDREFAENTRITNESTRVSNENIRISSENTRIANENERIGAENDRQAWEDERDENEDERILNESARVSTENTRVSAENTRISNENTRQSQESTRQTNESGRVNAENTRVSNESARVLAESARVSATATAIANAVAATDAANNAKGWQPLLAADTTTIPGKTLLKLQDWIGGTGTKPTTNVGQWQTAAGGYTANAASALDLNQIVTTNVSNDVADLKWANRNLEGFTLIGQFYQTNGTLQPSASGYNATPKYRVRAGMKFKNPTIGASNVAQAVFWSSDGTFLSATQTDVEIIAPANAYYVAFSQAPSASAIIKVQSDFWALQQSDTIAQHTVSGNKEVTVSSINFATNTFTSVAHGLVNSTINLNTSVGFSINTIAGQILSSWFPVALGDRYYVVNATTDTFQLSLSLGGAPITLINSGTTDITKWKIQVYTNTNYSFSNIADADVRFEITGGILGSTPSSALGTTDGVDYTSGTIQYSSIAGRIACENVLCGHITIVLRKHKNGVIVNFRQHGISLTGGNLVSKNITLLKILNTNVIGPLTGFAFTNGTTIKLMKP